MEPMAIRPADFARSDLFERTFAEGMDLVEEAAAYLEGPGREIARSLSREGALAYAGESMRLTTRLMQVASWLLVHQKVREGEMSDDQAREDRYRLSELPSDARVSLEGRGELPGAMLDLMDRTDRLYARISRLDQRMFGAPADVADPNPVARQLSALEAALRSGR